MSQRSAARSTTQLLQAKSLHPVLQAALGSLNVQLDEELTRYRRQRRGYVGVAHRSSARPQARKPLDLIAVSAVGGRTQPQPAEVRSPLAAPESQRRSPSSPRPASAPVVTRSTSPLAHSSELALADHWVDEAESVTPSASSQSALAQTTEANYDPYDYLESSEDLLRGLSEPEGEVVVQRSFWVGLATPLGLGSMLLLLVSSALLGYVLLHPSSFANLGFNRPGSNSSNNAQQPLAPQTQTPTAVLPNSPNLASKEFVDLNLNTLTTLKTDPKQVLPGPPRPPVAGAKLPVIPLSPAPKPAAVNNAAKPPARSSTSRSSVARPVRDTVPPVRPLPPAPTSAPIPSVVVERAPAPRNIQAVPRPPAPPVAPPRATQSQPKPASAPPRAIQSQPKPAPAASSPNYYIDTPYSGDRALEQVRQAVPDAYLVNLKDGAYIRMGTMSNEAGAREMVQKLQQQGIPAEVRQP